MTFIENKKDSNAVFSRRILLLFCCGFTLLLNSQTKFWKPSDSLSIQKATLLESTTATSWIISLYALNKVWYANFPSTKFHFFNDNNEWLQMDKTGHAFTAYQISNSLTKLHKWAGFQPKTAAIIGTSIAFGYQASIEYLDGKSKAWGFSPGDITANTIGCLLFLSQQLVADKQIVLFKESYSPSPYAALRPEILGKTPLERYLKDYNGQTYWLSFSPKSIFKNSRFPNWLCVSLGYSVDAKLKGDQNIYLTSNGMTYNAHREYLLSLDIDCSKLPIQNKFLKLLLRPFNAIKVPMPALLWRNGVCYARGMYF